MGESSHCFSPFSIEKAQSWIPSPTTRFLRILRLFKYLTIKISITSSVFPLLLMASLNLWLHESSELAVKQTPAGAVALGLTYLQDYLDGLRVECVNVNPDALVKHVVEGLQRVLISLFLCQPILLTPKTIGGSRCVFLHGSCTYCELRQVIFISSEFFV